VSSFPAGLHELAGSTYDPWVEDAEPESFWASGPDTEAVERAVERVERLLSRVPGKWALHARLSLEGISTIAAAKRIGKAQPTAYGHRKHATIMLAWAATTLPDLTSEEVLDVLLRAKGIRPKEARIAAAYWVSWDTTKTGVPQRTAYTILFDQRQYDRGIAHVLASRSGVEGDVGRGLLAIRDRPRFRSNSR
jgi:hypothetical protein